MLKDEQLSGAGLNRLLLSRKRPWKWRHIAPGGSPSQDINDNADDHEMSFSTMKVGYARVSTDGQDLELLTRSLRDLIDLAGDLEKRNIGLQSLTKTSTPHPAPPGWCSTFLAHLLNPKESSFEKGLEPDLSGSSCGRKTGRAPQGIESRKACMGRANGCRKGAGCE